MTLLHRRRNGRALLEEAAQATTADDPWKDASPLEHPQSALSDRQQRHLRPLGPLASLLARALLGLNRLLMRGAFRLQVQGMDRLPDGPVVIAPNHASYLDAPAVAAALPWHRLRSTYWGGWTGTLFANPLMRLLSRLMRVVPVDPQKGVMSSLAFGAAVLGQDCNLVWFPEGQRSRDGRLQRFRPGIGLLLERREALAVPTAIEGAYEAMPPGRWLPRPRRIRVTFGQPVQGDAFREADEEQEPQEKIAQRLQGAVNSMLES